MNYQYMYMYLAKRFIYVYISYFIFRVNPIFLKDFYITVIIFDFRALVNLVFYLKLFILGITQIQTYTEPMFMTAISKNVRPTRCRIKRSEKWRLPLAVVALRRTWSLRRRMRSLYPRSMARATTPQAAPPS